jgi:hypothetical protein
MKCQNIRQHIGSYEVIALRLIEGIERLSETDAA